MAGVGVCAGMEGWLVEGGQPQHLIEPAVSKRLREEKERSNKKNKRPEAMGQ